MSGIAGQSARVAPLESQSQLISLFMFPKRDKLVILPSFCTELFLFEIARSSQGLLQRGSASGRACFRLWIHAPKRPPSRTFLSFSCGQKQMEQTVVKPPNCVSRGTAILVTLVWICSFVWVSVYVSNCVCACPKRPLKGSQSPVRPGPARLSIGCPGVCCNF